MLKFFGFDLELFVDEALSGQDPMVRSATSFQGEHWLIVQVDQDPEHLVWICAPISARALREVTLGRVTMRDAVRHSMSGTVEVVTVDHGRAVPDRCFCCDAIPKDLLPASDRRVLASA